MSADEIGPDVERAHVDAFVTTTADAVWPLWTTAEGLERWWWPMFDDARYEVDAREDGWYRIRTSSGGLGVQGRYLELDEGRRIVQTWQWQGGDEGARQYEQVVTIDFTEQEDGTLIRVTQTAALDELESIREGWQDTLTRLEELVDDEG
jgi:uncharacterized protein YndB with AHSA1/START domain